MTTLELKVPKSGMGIDEVEIQQWLKQPGDSLSKGDVIVELETAKAVEELESPISGSVQRILVEAGETVAVGTVIAILVEQ